MRIACRRKLDNVCRSTYQTNNANTANGFRQDWRVTGQLLQFTRITSHYLLLLLQYAYILMSLTRAWSQFLGNSHSSMMKTSHRSGHQRQRRTERKDNQNKAASRTSWRWVSADYRIGWSTVSNAELRPRRTRPCSISIARTRWCTKAKITVNENFAVICQ